MKTERIVAYRVSILGEGLKCDICRAQATLVKVIDLYMETGTFAQGFNNPTLRINPGV